jgi:hypothetical protein
VRRHREGKKEEESETSSCWRCRIFHFKCAQLVEKLQVLSFRLAGNAPRAAEGALIAPEFRAETLSVVNPRL